jgi:hypothetical protein
MKKIIFAAILSAFCLGSVSAARACDGQKASDKSDTSTQAKKVDKKQDQTAKTDQKS